MPKTADTPPPAAETQPVTPEEQISRIKTEVGQALQPIRDAASAGDFATVKKLYRQLIAGYHADKFQDKTVNAEVQKLTVALNRIDEALKADVPDAQRVQLVETALEGIEKLTRTETASEVEASEADIETETALISHELESLGRECQATYDAMQLAQRRVYDLQMMQAGLEGLSEEYRSAHQKEIQKIWGSAAELQARLTSLNTQFNEAQMQLSYLRYFQQEKTALAEAPEQMRGLARQADAVREQIIAAQAEFDRENKIAETLNRQLEKQQAQYQALQTERGKVAQWQTFLDRQLFQHPPFTQAFNDNRRQRQTLDAQDAQIVNQMQNLIASMQNMNEQRMQNTMRLRQLWQEKLRLEAQGNQIFYSQTAMYEGFSQRQAAHAAARTNVSQIVRARKQARAGQNPEAEA